LLQTRLYSAATCLMTSATIHRRGSSWAGHRFGDLPHVRLSLADLDS